MVRWLAVFVVCVSVPAGAKPARPDPTFAAWVKARAKKLGAGIERWGVAQLDDDEALERFAVVCAEDGETATILVEKTRDLRWSFTRDLDGRNGCQPTAEPEWIAKPSRGIDISTGVHHGAETQTVALRSGTLAIVQLENEETNLPRDCSHEAVDLDALLRSERHCAGKQPSGDSAPPRMSPLRKAAVFVLDGASGTYREPRAGAPSFEVAATTLGKRARIAVKLARAAAAHDAVELWTVTATNQPMAWVATWDGAKWALSRSGHAPSELPELVGDATHIEVPVVRRDDGDPSVGTPLCIAWRSAAPPSHVATCELDPKDVRSFGLLYTARYRPPQGLHVEGK